MPVSWPAKEPSFSRQRNPGPHLLRFAGRDRRHVEGVGDGAGEQIIGNLLRHLQRDILLRFGGGGAQMRRRHDLLIAEQDIFLGRFDFEHVQRRAGDMAAVDRRFQRGFVDQVRRGRN